MVRPLAIHAGEHVWSSIPLSISLFVSATILVALCANHARKVSRNKHHAETSDQKATPKKVMATIGSKSLPLINNKKKNNGGDDQECEEATNKSRSHERFGEGTGLWQKAILMGEKCQPPEFSGVIYYDFRGNRVSELPRSPRTPPRTPRPNSSSFTNFAVSRDLN